MQRIVLWLSTVMLAIVLLGAGCGNDDDPPKVDPSRAVQKNAKFHQVIEISKAGFKPANARILVGGSVTFVNRDPDNYHTAASDGLFKVTKAHDEQTAFDTHLLTWNEPFTVTLTHYGTLEYVCTMDSSMKGTIDVFTRSPELADPDSVER